MDINLIIEKQEQINKLMVKYENITKQMLDCPVDDILGYTEKRQTLSEIITELDKQISDECIDSPIISAAYKNKCARNELDESGMRVFDLRQKFNSIAFRVSGMEPQITERIIILKNDLMNKIKKNNSGQNAKAAKYAGAGLSGGKKPFFPENKKSI